LQNEGFKELIVKIGVDPNDREAIKALMQSTKSKMQLRKKLKLPMRKHVKTTKFDFVKKEKEQLMILLTKRNKEIISLKEKVQDLDQIVKNNV